MPRASAPAKPVPAKPATPAPPKAAKKPVERPVLYPNYAVGLKGHVLTDEETTLTFTKAVDIFGYRAEDEYIAEMVAKDQKLGLKTDGLKFGDDFLWTNVNNQKCRADHNANNRPFDALTSAGYKQSVLTGEWELNGETIIIDEFGDVNSGQHRLAGFIDAVLLWRKDPYWKRFWKTEPTMQCTVIFGVKGTQKIRSTFDNVRPRQLSDTIYTSEIFASLDIPARKECSRMLDAAVDLFWKRTGAAFDAHVKIQTHAASHDLLDNHPKLKIAVRHLHEENKGRAISLLKLSAGQCAGLCYLMGAAGSDKTKYDANRVEKSLDLKLWDRAEEFWTLLSGKHKDTQIVIDMLGKVVNGDYGTLELNQKKLAVVVNAWNHWIAGTKLTADNIEPDCVKNTSGELVLGVFPNLGGIDLGDKPEPEDDKQSETDTEAAKQKAKDDRAAALANKVPLADRVANSENPIKEAVNILRKAHPEHLLLFLDSKGELKCYGPDAEIAAATQGAKAKHHNNCDMLKYIFPTGTDVDTVAGMLRIKAGKVSLVEDDGEKVTPLLAKPKPPIAKPAPAVAPTPAPAAKPTPAPAPKVKNGPTLKLRPGNASK